MFAFRSLAVAALLAGLCWGRAPSAREILGSLPLRFEPNQGQFPRQFRFAAQVGEYRAFFSERDVRLGPVRISLPGSNPSPRVKGVGLLGSRTNYFVGDRRNWRQGIPNYSRLRYEGVYPGIDLAFYGSREGLEYDFIVAPGADWRRIRIRFDGIDRLSLTREGDLLLTAGGRELIQRKPVVHQHGRQVPCRYRLLGRKTVGVELAAHDRRRPLVIDPVLVYASFLGTDNNDAIAAIKLDAEGMVYVTGYVSTGAIPATAGAYNPDFKGGRDVFVAKLNPRAAGPDSLVYFTYLGGSGSDMPTSMVVGANGMVYLAGSTTSADFPLAGNAVQIQLGGETDAFVARLNPATPGEFALNYSTYLGGAGTDIAYAIDIDANGDMYVAGVTRSDNFPITRPAIQEGLWSDQDGFVVKLSSDPDRMTVAYGTYFGGDTIDEARAIAVAAPDRVFVAGTTSSAVFPSTANAFQPGYHGGGDIFVSELDLSRPGYDAVVYSTYLGGSGDDEVRRMVIDPAGRLVLTGFTLSNNFPVTPDAFQPAPARQGTVFITRLDTRQSGSAALSYSTYLGGSGGEVAYDVVADGDDNVYVTGYTLSSDFPVTPDAYQRTYGGGVEVFCTALNLAAPPARALVYSSYIGGAGINVGYGIAVSRDGTIYLAGTATDRQFPITDTAFQTAYAGGISDGFVLGLNPREAQ